MLTDELVIKVKNRDNGTVGYDIPDMHLHRHFNPGETKDNVITWRELKGLQNVQGGDYILRNCLIIYNKEAVDYLMGRVEPEYYYSENDVKKLLSEGSLAQLQDCLDFAPTGVIELVKEYSVKLEIADLRKREAIQKKTGFNVTAAIMHEQESKEEAEEEPTKKTRRADPINSETATEEPARRSEPISKYSTIEE